MNIFLSYPDYFLKAKIIIIIIILEEEGSGEEEDVEVWCRYCIEMANNPIAGNMVVQSGLHSQYFSYCFSRWANELGSKT